MPYNRIKTYINNSEKSPLFLQGDALVVLKSMPDECIDCVVTSPPYWGKRQYSNGGIGQENNYIEYIDNLMNIINEIHRVLKKTGVFWLNIGDSYKNKHLIGIPWRVALRMVDCGWILRNDVIWYKHKGGMCASKDRFGLVYEDLFFFAKSEKYFFDANAVRLPPRATIQRGGNVISATGVSGVKYRKQIETSVDLSEEEKRNAFEALENVIRRMQHGDISDFRMVIRNQQRTTHSNSEKVSGRAKELKDKGFYFLFYHPSGAMPGNVWEIIPEDTQGRKSHYAPYPEELCLMPIKSSCPIGGIVLDPFSGTGTTAKVAYELGFKSIGIDLSEEYNQLAQGRITPMFNFNQP